MPFQLSLSLICYKKDFKVFFELFLGSEYKKGLIEPFLKDLELFSYSKLHKVFYFWHMRH